MTDVLADAARLVGAPADQVQTTTISVSLSPELLGAVDAAVAAVHGTRSRWIRQAIVNQIQTERAYNDQH